MKNYAPIIERFKEEVGAAFRAAAEADLVQLQALHLPETILGFYRQFEPVEVLENSQTVRLLPIAQITEDNTEMSPGCYTAPHGYVVFASNFSGDAYAFDCQQRNEEGEPRILLFAHEMFSDDLPPDWIPKMGKPVAAHLYEFLEQFLDGSVDEECLSDDEIDV